MADDRGPLPPLHRQLRSIELFAGLADDELAWVAEAGAHRALVDGDVLFTEGDPARLFYVLLSGEVLLTKVLGGHEVVLSRHSTTHAPASGPDGKPRAAHQFTGELPLLTGSGYVATATAVGPTEVLSYDHQTFHQMLERCPQTARVLLPVLAWRVHTYELHIGRSMMLEGLDTLAAGLAHELNNPTAALVRCAAEMRTAVADLADWATRWGQLATSAERLTLDQLRTRLTAAGAAPPRSVLAAADAADELTDALDALGVATAEQIGPILADGGLRREALDELVTTIRAEALEAGLGCLSYTLFAAALADEVSEAGGRITALTQLTKSYTNLDAAPQRDVDIHEGLEVTLALRAPMLAGIRIDRHYCKLPAVEAYPAELNQVWTSLIDNAAEAMAGSGELSVSTREEGGKVVVEIRDTGHGIPADVVPIVFQPFFTTKGVGQGCGLGLHLSRDIVTNRHGGSIDVTSEPGDTRFTVRLPLGPAARPRSTAPIAGAGRAS
jgi:signal transduction histidine kinase